MAEKAYTYVSTRACYDPAKTLFICPPSECAGSYGSAMQFAKSSGWLALAEYDGAVLIIPIVEKGWQDEDPNLPGNIYDSLRNSFSSRNGKSLFGRGGKIWCWETLVYIAGYGDGADFAGDCVVANPNRFAAAALIHGAPRNFEPGENPSSHWLVRNVSADYGVKNNQVPSCVWMLGTEEGAMQKALEYFEGTDHLGQAQEVCVETIPAIKRCNPNNPAEQILVSHGNFKADLLLSQAILNGLFDTVIRWKNGPDGTLALHPGQTGFYGGARFLQDGVTVNTLDYPYAIHLPQGMGKEEAAGLPLVFSVHGRGEPAWLFATKNGWDTLADETREFVLAVPDSTGNIWELKRDGKAFGAMIDKICSDYRLDKTRVYLTGFSNGAAITREVGTTYPQWFAGISPWNGPVGVSGNGIIMQEAIAPTLLSSGYEMPYFAYVGDNDATTGSADANRELAPMLAANGCTAKKNGQGNIRFEADEVRSGSNYYTPSRGYQSGERFYTRIYNGPDGLGRVGYTVMKNMPHGAIGEQSKAAWEFLRNFSRPQGSKKIVVKNKGENLC